MPLRESITIFLDYIYHKKLPPDFNEIIVEGYADDSVVISKEKVKVAMNYNEIIEYLITDRKFEIFNAVLP